MKTFNLINHKFRIYLLLGAFFCAALFIIGCQEPRLSSSDQVKAFELAGPIIPQVDIDKLLSVKNNNGIYTVGTADVLELQMPTILTAVSPRLYKDQQQQVEPYLCRVSDSGTITLPILGQTNVEGKTLAQIEDQIVNAYYPRYIVVRPSVVCSVKEYHLRNVTIVGAVMKPGVYPLQSNEMSLVNALMKAGGIVEGGASVITIKNPQRKHVSYSATAKPADDVKQWAELATEANEQYIEDIETPTGRTENTDENNAAFSTLEVDLVFRPENSSPTKGTVLVQRGSDTLYAKNINIENQSERNEYIKELEKVIGNKQANIIGQALEQLASQIPPAVTASQIKPSSEEETELLEAADESKHDSIKDQDTIKEENYPSYNQKYIETPSDSKVEVETINSANDVESIKPADSNYQPAPSTTAAVVEPIVLPVKGLNIPFADVPLMEGDLIEVKRLNLSVFTVIGLAKSPGAFPYPPDVEYNLMQAIGFAGGVDLIADPRFVTIYRQDAKDNVVSATFRVDKKFMAKSYNVKIKPGDVISIDVTPRTKRNVLLHQILRINFGVYIRPDFLGGD